MNNTRFAAALLIAALFAAMSFSNLFSQDMRPKQAESKFLDQLVGTWTGVVETPMGKSNTTAIAEWSVNHQFVVIKVEGIGIDNPMNNYLATEYYQPLENGKLAFWSFNGFGDVSTGTGTAVDNKYEYSSSGKMGKETGIMTADGSNMNFKSKGTYSINGQIMDFDMTGIFKRK